MVLVQVKKVVAVCFLEAAKLTLDHLGQHRLELSQQGVTGTADLPRIYGELRRLRDFLQRCVSSYPEVVDLELTPADAGLLVACCRRAIEMIELRLTEQALAPEERQWLQKKRQVVGDWAVELAAKPLVDLPLKRLSPVIPEGVRALTVRLQNKVFGDVRERNRIVPPSGSTSNSMATGIAPTFAAGNELQMAPPPPQQPVAPTQVVPFTADLPADEPEPLFEHVRIRDPRLRTLAGMELRSYERALRVDDHRVATVLLASVLECALLDHLMPRRAEFGLQGTPDSWNLQELLLKALGEQAQPKDASLAFHLFAARNLLRPAVQLVTPAVVTTASHDRLREFVARVLHAFGFGQPRATLPPGSLKASDLAPPGSAN